MLPSPPPQSPVLKHHPPSSFQSFPSGKEGALRSRSQLRSNFFFFSLWPSLACCCCVRPATVTVTLSPFPYCVPPRDLI
ncbi:hypothetical protein K456DRAFT_1602789 [Colletotrichum gloeosporioides 23]|nr:hypothetical protein K456DRAFT_1602789 [Colletotrichum gloeosporioides 23]